MRTLILSAVSAIALAATGCGGGHRRTAPPPHWVQQANAVCKRDDPRAELGDFDSAAMIAGLRREATDLARVGFFRRIPAAAVDVALDVPLDWQAATTRFGQDRRHPVLRRCTIQHARPLAAGRTHVTQAAPE